MNATGTISNSKLGRKSATALLGANSRHYLAKPWAAPRQLWTAIAKLPGIATPTCDGD